MSTLNILKTTPPCHNEPVVLRTLGYILHLPSSLFFIFHGAKGNFKVTYAGHFNQVVRRIQQHADI